MQIAQIRVRGNTAYDIDLQKVKAIQPHFLMLFGPTAKMNKLGLGARIVKSFGELPSIGCSTAGEISDQGVSDDTVVVTGVRFDDASAKVLPVSAKIEKASDSYDSGVKLAQSLDPNGLKGFLVFGRGVNIDGTALVEGLRKVLGKEVPISGGLAGDGANFLKTTTLLNGQFSEDEVVGFGLYGEKLSVAFGSRGGWEPFGDLKQVTRADGNILMEIEGEPALTFYKRMLGNAAKDLPMSGLYYPFCLYKEKTDQEGIIRTILGVDPSTNSITLAGSVQGAKWIRTMISSKEKLAGGARAAAEASKASSIDGLKPGGLGVLVSCVGRKLVMDSATDQEIQEVKTALPGSRLAGFYSYGEICYSEVLGECALHNQTMTITYINDV